MGLRSQHYPVITETWPKVDWFEAISENYMDTGGRPLQILEEVRKRYPVALHGTALSIGSVDPLNERYLKRLKSLVDRIEPFIVSDHLCWSGTEGEQLHDLLPLPFTEETLRHVAARVQKVQEALDRPILLENVSTYVTFKHSTMPEWDFLAEVARLSGCGILLDINNLYVNSFNHKFDPMNYLNAIPAEKVGQIHLAGHTDRGDFLFDTHSRPVIDKVWALYEEALKRFGQVSTLIEWDEDIPEFEELQREVEKAKAIYTKFQGGGQKAEGGNKKAFPSAFSPQPSASELSLAQAQHLFRAQMRHRANDPSINNLLNPQAGTPGRERIEVYADGYPARIREALGEVYEAVHAAVGDEAFHDLALAYAGEHVSRDYNLNHAGLEFPEFLGKAPITQEAAFLPDLARFEWAIWDVFHGLPNQEAASPEELAKVSAEDWERSQILFRKPLFIFKSQWPVLELWKVRRNPSAASALALENNPQTVLISRKENQVRCEVLQRDQARLLEGLLGGQTLGAACEALAEISGSEEWPIGDWFASWMRDGLIAGCLVPEKTGALR